MRSPQGSPLPNPMSLVESKHHRFVIFDAPNEANLSMYIEELKRYKVTQLVRTCHPTYSKETMESAGITVHELPFEDGKFPPPQIVNQWLRLLREHSDRNETIGVHCVAGLGRAPLLVAIALIEYGMPPLEAMTLIRKKRPEAFHLNSIKYLLKYKRHSQKQCIIM
eukprot:gene2927-3367_t